LYSSPNVLRMIKSRSMGWVRRLARKESKRTAYRILVGKPVGQRPLRTPRRKWVDIIKMDLREMGLDGTEWIGLCQDGDQPGRGALVNTVMKCRVSRMAQLHAASS
jgi:hypothetical protein